MCVGTGLERYVYMYRISIVQSSGVERSEDAAADRLCASQNRKTPLQLEYNTYVYVM